MVVQWYPKVFSKEVADLARDPICKMQVDEKTAKFKSTHMGETFYFCSASCRSETECEYQVACDGFD